MACGCPSYGLSSCEASLCLSACLCCRSSSLDRPRAGASPCQACVSSWPSLGIAALASCWWSQATQASPLPCCSSSLSPSTWYTTSPRPWICYGVERSHCWARRWSTCLSLVSSVGDRCHEPDVRGLDWASYALTCSNYDSYTWGLTLPSGGSLLTCSSCYRCFRCFL